jgi:hypothetical protein
MVRDGGAPHCPACGEPLRFDADRQGRTTEVCACGYRGYLETRPGEVEVDTTLGEGPAHPAT